MTQYVLTLVGVFVLALIIDGLAPQFGGTRSRVQAMKVAAYSATAGWVAAVDPAALQALLPGRLGDYRRIELSSSSASAAGLGGSQAEARYEKGETVDGRLVTEEWDNAVRDGRYGVIVADRFMIEASGNVPNVDVLKGAVGAVGLDRVEALAG